MPTIQQILNEFAMSLPPEQQAISEEQFMTSALRYVLLGHRIY